MSLLTRLYADVDNPAVGTGHLATYFSEDFADFDRNPNSPGHLSDREAHLAFFDELKRGFADLSHKLTLMEPLPDGKVVVYWTFEGTHQGAFFGVPASGKRARTNGIDIYTLRDGQIVEQRHCEDVAGLMAQIAP
jgi:steroid delta-isomerase-like uncharacterized protein